MRSKLQKQTLQFKSIVIYPHHFCKGRERRFTANLQSFSFLSCGGLPAGVNLCIFSQSGLWGTSVPGGLFAGAVASATPLYGRSTPCPSLTMRGGATPSALPEVGALAPTPPCMGAPPQAPGDFPVAGKVTKGAPRAAALWNPASTTKPPFSRSLTHRAGLPSATTKDRFATLGLWANRSYFFPKLH